MQAIQAIENPALEVPRRSSPFRALVWKEWRQQRWIFLSLAALAYALLLPGVIVARSGLVHGDFKNDVARVLWVCAAFLGLVGIVILSANAFSGERENNTEQFLDTIPCSRSKIFRCKLGFVLFLVLLGLIPLGVTDLFYVGPQPRFDLVNPVGEWGPTFLAFAADLIVLVSVPALMASICGSVISTIFVSIPVAAGCLAWVRYSSLWLPRLVPVRVEWLIWPYALLVATTTLLAARRLWLKTEGTWRLCVPTFAATAGLLISYTVVPMVAAWLYVTCIAPLSFFMGPYGRPASGYIRGASPNGEYVVFEASYNGWGEMVKLALVDVKSGRSQWVTRLHYSGPWVYGRKIWTPSGNAFVEEELHIKGSEMLRTTYFLVHAKSGGRSSFEDLCPGLPENLSTILIPLVGWYNEHVFAFTDARDIFFADAEHHQVQRCSVPGAFRAHWFRNPFQLLITRTGIFSAPSFAPSRRELCVLRFAPDLPEAQSLIIRNVPHEADLIHASSDGQWLLLNSGLYRSMSLYTARSENGATATLLWSEESNEKAPISPPWQVEGFLPGGHEVFLYGGGEILLLDADTRASRQISLATLNGTAARQIESVELSATGEFALVQFWNPDSRPGVPIYIVVDLRQGTSWTVLNATLNTWPGIRWLGNDHLLLQEAGQLWIMNRDGTERQPLLLK